MEMLYIILIIEHSLRNLPDFFFWNVCYRLFCGRSLGAQKLYFYYYYIIILFNQITILGDQGAHTGPPGWSSAGQRLAAPPARRRRHLVPAALCGCGQGQPTRGGGFGTPVGGAGRRRALQIPPQGCTASCRHDINRDSEPPPRWACLEAPGAALRRRHGALPGNRPGLLRDGARPPPAKLRTARVRTAESPPPPQTAHEPLAACSANRRAVLLPASFRARFRTGGTGALRRSPTLLGAGARARRPASFLRSAAVIGPLVCQSRRRAQGRLSRGKAAVPAEAAAAGPGGCRRRGRAEGTGSRLPPPPRAAPGAVRRALPASPRAAEARRHAARWGAGPAAVCSQLRAGREGAVVGTAGLLERSVRAPREAPRLSGWCRFMASPRRCSETTNTPLT